MTQAGSDAVFVDKDVWSTAAFTAFLSFAPSIAQMKPVVKQRIAAYLKAICARATIAHSTRGDISRLTVGDIEVQITPQGCILNWDAVLQKATELYYTPSP